MLGQWQLHLLQSKQSAGMCSGRQRLLPSSAAVGVRPVTGTHLPSQSLSKHLNMIATFSSRLKPPGPVTLGDLAGM